MRTLCDICSDSTPVPEDGQALCWPCRTWTSDNPTTEAVAMADLDRILARRPA